MGIWTGKLADLSVARTAVISRALTALTCVVVATAAIAASGEAAAFLLVLLTLPMSLSLFGSISQDGPMLVAAACVIALLTRLRQQSDRKVSAALIWLCVTLALLAIGRPPYATFAVLPLLLRGLMWRTRILAVAAILLPVALWSGLAASVTMINSVAHRGVNAAAQVQALLAHPGRVWDLMVHAATDRQGMEGLSFYKEFVGVLGWIDVVLPGWYYVLAGVTLSIALLLLVVRAAPLLPPVSQGVCFGAALASVGAIFVLQYLTWTPVGWLYVDGVQGRYFLPIALLIPAFAPAMNSARFKNIQGWAALLIAPFPMVSTVVAVSSIVRRYYL